MVLKFSKHLNHLKGLLNQIVGSIPRVSDSLCLGWDSRGCSSKKLPGDEDDDASLGTSP